MRGSGAPRGATAPRRLLFSVLRGRFAPGSQCRVSHRPSVHRTHSATLGGTRPGSISSAESGRTPGRRHRSQQWLQVCQKLHARLGLKLRETTPRCIREDMERFCTAVAGSGAAPERAGVGPVRRFTGTRSLLIGPPTLFWAQPRWLPFRSGFSARTNQICMGKQKNVLTVNFARGRAARIPIDCPRPPEAPAGLARPAGARGGGESGCKLGDPSGVLIFPGL